MQPSLFDSVERDQKEGRVTQQADSAPTMPTRVGFRDLELMESSILAQDTFMRQMKRYRKKQGVSLAEVARSIAELQGDLPPGESLGVAELEKLENGTRLPKGAEGELIANALGTTVEWLLGSTFMDGVPEYLKEPPTDEELQAEAKAMEQRMVRVGMRVNGARNQYAMAREREDEARRQASWAQAILENAASEQRKLEQQYQYLLGRIDSIRAAKGEDLVVQVHPVYGDD
jgi:transcriptional regulator with XRE-family HTH domain